MRVTLERRHRFALRHLLSALTFLVLALPAGVSAADITGTVYTNEGITPIGANKTVNVSINGATAAATAETDAGGQFTLPGLTITGGTILTLYLDNETEKAVTVSLGSGANMTGMHLYQNMLIVRSGTGTHASVGSPLSSTMLDVANNNGDADISAVYTMSSLDAAVVNGKKLYVWTGSTLNLGGTLTVNSELHLNGSLNQNNSAITVNGPFTQSGGTFRGSLGGIAIAINGHFIQSGGVFISTTGPLTVTASYNPTSFILRGGTFDPSTGTVTLRQYWRLNVNVNATQTFNNLEIATGTSNNGLTIPSDDTVIVSGTLILTSGQFTSGTLTARGPVSVASTFSGGGDGTVLIDGAGVQSFTIPSGVYLPNITLNSPLTTISFADGANASIAGLNIQAGTFVTTNGTLTLPPSGGITRYVRTGGTFNHNNGTIAIAGNTTGSANNIDVPIQETFNNLTVNIAGGGGVPGVTIGNGDTLVVIGRLSHTDGFVDNGRLQAQGDVMIGTAANGGTTSLQFTGAGTQVVEHEGGTAPSGGWTIAKPSGTVSLSGALTLNAVGQDLIMTGGTLDLNGNNLTVNDVFTVGTGTTLRLEGTESITGGPDHVHKGSTIYYDDPGGTTQLKNFTYRNLVIGSTGSTIFTFPTPTALAMSGSLTISGGTLRVTNGQTLTLSGTWLKSSASNAGFTAGSGTVTLDGGHQTLSGSTTFYNLTKTVSAPRTLTFAATTTQTIANTLTLQGGSSNLLSLRSSQDGTQWKIDPQGTRAVQYLDVMDSHNTNATTIDASDGTNVNSLNNTNWAFIPPSTPPTITSPASGSTTNDATPAIAGTGSVATNTIRVYSGATVLCTTTVNNDASKSWTCNSSSLVDGVYTIRATEDNGTESAASSSVTFTVDASVPSAPGTPDLQAGSDTGSSSTDNITKDATSTFSVSCETGATVSLLSGSTVLGTGSCASSTVSITSSTLVAGVYGIRATQEDAAGNVSATSSALSVTIDTTAPTVSTLSPADGAMDVAITASLVIAFGETVSKDGTGTVTIKKSSDDSTVETVAVTSSLVTGSGTTDITINPSSNLENNTGYYVQISNSAFYDDAGNNYPGISSSTTWNFTTIAASSSSSSTASSPAGSSSAAPWPPAEEMLRV